MFLFALNRWKTRNFRSCGSGPSTLLPIGRGVPPSQLRPGGAPHHGDAQAGTIGYFFLCKFSITVRPRGKCAWSSCGGVSAIHWSSETSA